eukprot:15430521-Alexandrium_andersonii.AAC.1
MVLTEACLGNADVNTHTHTPCGAPSLHASTQAPQIVLTTADCAAASVLTENAHARLARVLPRACLGLL